MRKPRPGDFDPDYKNTDSIPKPESIDVSGVVPIREKPKNKELLSEKIYDRSEKRTEDRSEIRTEERTEERTDNRTAKLPVKRITKRYSFEFFEDQITHLKQIKYQTEMTGERIAMSVIVREALDEYLRNRTDEKPFDRTEERSETRTEKRPT
jgi:hypothetical protein